MDRNIDKLKNVFYVGHIGAEGTAMAIHTRNIAKLLNGYGYNVSFICQCVPKKHKRYSEDDYYNYFYTKQYIKIPKLSAIEWMIEEMSGIKLFNLFKNKLNNEGIDLVIFYGYSGEKKIIDFCKRKKIKVLIDRTDWFDKDDRKGLFGKIFTKYCADKCIKKYDFYADGVISISKFFYDFYKKQGQNTFWMPPIFEVPKKDKIEIKVKSKEVIRLVYAGSLGGTKDIIDPIIEILLNKYNKDKIQFTLDLVGINNDQLDVKFGKNNWEGYGVFAHGRLPHSETVKIISNSDFSFLLRHNKRYAKAGFSTKFAESMSYGVPVICTQVGGADLLIKNMKNGILLKDNKKDTIESVLSKIINFTEEDIYYMKNNAYRDALRYFDYNSYEQKFNKFIKGDINIL
ncbi:TPA: glycosyltransferase [Clostridium perfringens]